MVGLLTFKGGRKMVNKCMLDDLLTYIHRPANSGFPPVLKQNGLRIAFHLPFGHEPTKVDYADIYAMISKIDYRTTSNDKVATTSGDYYMIIRPRGKRSWW